MNGPISRLEFFVFLIVVFVGLYPFLKRAPEVGDWYWRWISMSQIDPGLLVTIHIALIVLGVVVIFNARFRN